MIAENHRERGTLMLDFRVETFLAVCRHMNFTRAARELSITQPAVSHHIRYLDKTTPRLIQFHTLKNAANPPFLGVFSIFGTVAA